MAIASLTVALKANTAAFAQAMDRAKNLSVSNMKGIERSAKIMGAAFLAAGAAAAAGLGLLVKGQIDAADALAKLSDKTGFTVESLSVLQHAASLAGASMEQINGALARMSRAAFDAASGLKEPAEAFKALGVSVTDANGRMRQSDAIFADVVEALGNIENATARSALAQKVFGRSAVELQPLLKALAKGGFEAAWIEAEKLGLIISTKTARAAAKFNDNLKLLKGPLLGLGNAIMAEVLPPLLAFTNGLVDAAKQSDGIQALGRAIGNAFKHIAETVVRSIAGLKNFATLLGTIAEAALAITLNNYIKAITVIDNGLREMVQQQEEAADQIQGIWGAALPPLEKVAAAQDAITEAAKDNQKAVESLLGSLREQNETFGMGAVALAEYRLATLGAGEAQLALGAALAQSVAFKEAQKVFEELPKKIETISSVISGPLTGSFNSSNQQLREFVGMLMEFGLTLERATNLARLFFKEGIAPLEEKAKKISKLGQDIGLSFASAFDQAIMGGKKFGEVLKALLLDLVKMLAFRFIFGPLFGGVGDFLGSIFGGGKQHGGPVLPNRSFLVGERGPELFVPATAGRIVPNPGGVVQNLYIDARGAKGGTEADIRRALAAAENRASLRAILSMREAQLRTA